MAVSRRSGANRGDPELAAAMAAGRTGLESAGVPCIDLPTSAPAPLSIFAYEAQFNDLVFQLIRRLGVNQRQWPSKGKDDPLYGFYRMS